MMVDVSRRCLRMLVWGGNDGMIQADGLEQFPGQMSWV